MTKLIKKEDCKFKKNRIVKDDEIVGIPMNVWLQLNKLETMFQQWNYLRAQPAYHCAPSLDGWVRKSDIDKDLPYVDMPDTPVGDARVEEALAFMKEVDACSDAVVTNDMIDRFSALIHWCNDGEFIEGNCTDPIDTPCLGNPLDIDADAIVKVLKMIVSSPIELGD